jgi:hypothetical protein
MVGFSAATDEGHSIKLNSNRGAGEQGSPAQLRCAVPRTCPMSGTGVLEVAMKCRRATAPPEEI